MKSSKVFRLFCKKACPRTADCRLPVCTSSVLPVCSAVLRRAFRFASLISSVAKGVPLTLISSVAKGVPLSFSFLKVFGPKHSIVFILKVFEGRSALFSVPQGVWTKTLDSV
ncbi:unnamed protein product [Rodentolepis nana]|uniref:Secreted protein n=1 Tax=Rodentolepis nana TaxID=102285 RepID=A0A0R3TB96_RODNA|nr:unnamed protein product [Rodentolepis nana]